MSKFIYWMICAYNASSLPIYFGGWGWGKLLCVNTLNRRHCTIRYLAPCKSVARNGESERCDVKSRSPLWLWWVGHDCGMDKAIWAARRGTCSQGTYVQTTNIILDFSLASIFLSYISVCIFFFT